MADNVFRVDGLVVNDYANSGPGSSLHVNMGVDAIREFSVLTNNYSAEYGRGSSGVINAINKSGTNDFHGSAYYFHRNAAFDARNFFDAATVPPFRRHQYGGALGGRIKKDKSFFFTNYETLTELKAQSTSFDTLTANARLGNLTSGPVTVDPRIKPYLAIYPLPNGPITGDVGKFLAPSIRLGDEKFVMLKMDHYFSTNTTLNGSYMFDDTTVSSPDQYIGKLKTAPSRRQNGVLSLQHIFSPTLINNTRVGITRTWAGNEIDGKAFNPLLEDLSLGFIPGRTVGGFTVGGLTGGALFGGIGASGYNLFGYTAPQLYNDLAWTKGRHSMRMGFAIERVHDNLDERNRPNGLWTFGSISNLLRVIPDQFSAQFPGTDAVRGQRNSIIAGYFQDDYRIRPNLTINLGVRYEVSTVIKEVQGKIGNLRNLTDPRVTTGNPLYNNPTFKNFAPRIGFAWDPFRDGKTAIRGGVGMFDIIPLPYLFVFLFPRTAPFFIEGTVNSSPSTGNILGAAFPKGGFPLLTLPTAQAIHTEFNPSRAYKMQWNLNIQRQLSRSLALTAGYVGSSGVHLANSIYDNNQVTPDRVQFVNNHYVFPIPTAASPLIKTNPNYGQIRSLDWRGHSSYHSLQVNLVQRPTKGLNYQVAYTFSKSLDNGTAATADNESLNSLGSPYAYCLRCNRGRSDFDLTQNLVMNFLYDVPVAAAVKSHSVANAILGGWQLGGIYVRQSGGLFNLKIPTDRAFTGNSVVAQSQGGQRGDWLAAAPGCSNPTTGDVARYVKTECFAFPAPGVLGNLGRNNFRMPVFRNLDFSVFKNQNVWGERLKAQFRVETFNLMNNTNLTGQTYSVFQGNGLLSPTAGTPLFPTVNTSRQIQLGLRLIF